MIYRVWVVNVYSKQKQWLGVISTQNEVTQYRGANALLALQPIWLEDVTAMPERFEFEFVPLEFQTDRHPHHGLVKFASTHYEAGKPVCGSRLNIDSEGRYWIYHDEPYDTRRVGKGTWVEVDVHTYQKLKETQ